MKRNFGKMFVLHVLISLLLIVCGTCNAFAYTYAGNNEDINWNLDKDTGVLHIYVVSGNGVADKFTMGYRGSVNGKELAGLVETVYFDEGITYIGKNVLIDNTIYPSCTNTKTVYIASTVSGVADGTFNFSGIQDVYIYSENISIGSNSFAKNTVLHGYADSNVKSFAEEHGYVFEEMCKTHIPKVVNYTEPSCEEKGYSGDTICSVCEVVIEAGMSIDALGHDYQNLNKVEPDCITKGYSGDLVCVHCEDVKELGSEIDAKGHSFSDWQISDYPSCTESGIALRICSECNETERQIIDSLGHDYITVHFDGVEGKEGYTQYTCLICKYSYSVTDSVITNPQTPTDIPSTPTDVLPLGDLNGDTQVNAKDALEVLKAAVGKTRLTDSQKNAADVNKDGNINAKDALEILKKAVGKPACF